MPPPAPRVGRPQSIVTVNVGEKVRLRGGLLSSGSVKKVYASRSDDDGRQLNAKPDALLFIGALAQEP